MAEAGPLNLGDADLKGFEAVDPGSYNVVVHEMKMDAVKNTSGEGKMPAGTPMVKIQWRATEDNPEGLDNRRFFSQFIIPPKSYDKKKAQIMKGMLAKAFIALGESEETVRNDKFNPDFEDYVGREAVIVVGKEPKKIGGEVIHDEFNNPVKAIKPAGSISGNDGGGLL